MVWSSGWREISEGSKYPTSPYYSSEHKLTITKTTKKYKRAQMGHLDSSFFIRLLQNAESDQKENSGNPNPKP